MGYCGNEKQDALTLQILLSCGYPRSSLPKSLFLHLVKPFAGTGTEDVDKYFEELESRAEYENWSESDLLLMFKYRLTGNAETYCRVVLDPEGTLNYQEVKNAFQKQFGRRNIIERARCYFKQVRNEESFSDFNGSRNFYPPRRRGVRGKRSKYKEPLEVSKSVSKENGNQATNKDTNKPRELESYVNDIRGRDCSHDTSRNQFEVGDQFDTQDIDNSSKWKTPGRNRGEDAKDELSDELEERWARLRGKRQEVVQVQENTTVGVVGSGGEYRKCTLDVTVGTHSEVVAEVDRKWQEILAEVEAESMDSGEGVERKKEGWNQSTRDAAGARRSKFEDLDQANESRSILGKEKKNATRQDDCKKVGQVGLGRESDDNVRDGRTVGVVVPCDTVNSARSDNLIPVEINTAEKQIVIRTAKTDCIDGRSRTQAIPMEVEEIIAETDLAVKLEEKSEPEVLKTNRNSETAEEILKSVRVQDTTEKEMPTVSESWPNDEADAGQFENADVLKIYSIRQPHKETASCLRRVEINKRMRNLFFVKKEPCWRRPKDTNVWMKIGNKFSNKKPVKRCDLWPREHFLRDSGRPPEVL